MSDAKRCAYPGCEYQAVESRELCADHDAFQISKIVLTQIPAGWSIEIGQHTFYAEDAVMRRISMKVLGITDEQTGAAIAAMAVETARKDQAG